MITEADSVVRLSDGREVRLRNSRPHLEDFTGRQFGELTVLGYGELKQFKTQCHSVWIAECSCGHIGEYLSGNLRRGLSTRCQQCAYKLVGDFHRVHGGAGTPEYGVWQSMIQRCTNQNATGYQYWGGRGIGVCERWRRSFAAFLKDMGPRPSDKHSIDRIENDGDYCPGNCRWATPREQAKNKRWPAKEFTVNGRTGNMAYWSRQLGISREGVRQRLLKYPPEVALTTPKGEPLKA